MLRLSGVSLARGARVLYRDATALAPPGERIGLVGANGCGKSTLFAAILGELALEAGDLQSPPQERIAHVAQEVVAPPGTTALDYVLEGHAPLTRARSELARAEAALHEHPGDPDREMDLAHAYASMAEVDPGAVAAQAQALLHGLGFPPGAGEREVTDFSGGWRNRLALARALLRPADLLLLDEPTNHLDIDSIIWLEAWLRRQEATVLIISHDREFLDRCVGAIWHVGDGTLRRYAGNYSAFEEALAERRRQQDAQARSTQRTAAHLQSFVDRFRAQATKARQAQSRLKMLERLVLVEPSRASHEWRFEFPQPRARPERLVDASDLTLGYGSRTVVSATRFAIEAGDRIGILGVNGAGKSTLVKAITGELSPMGGHLKSANGVVVGYFAQHQLDQFEGEETPLQLLRRMAPQAREQELRDHLGRYRFSGELSTAPTGRMSGGEKARCALALIAWQRPNLLVLDEPTNHLDMETREALTMALADFEGALLLVSHDRHLLRAATDQLWLVHEGQLSSYDGDLDEYATLVLASRKAARNEAGNERRARASAKSAAAAEPGGAEEAGRRREADARIQQGQQRKPLQQKLAKIEREMAPVNEALKAVDARLADPGFYNAASSDVAGVLKERTLLAAKLERLEGQWLEAQEALEQL
jgi:ATP-binding cassette subfamily F protein 3